MTKQLKFYYCKISLLSLLFWTDDIPKNVYKSLFNTIATAHKAKWTNKGLTGTLGFRARPGEPVLTDSGGAARQLMAAGAFEITGGPVVVAITVTIHVPVVRSKELAAAAHWHMKQKQRTWWAERKDKAKAATGGRSVWTCVLWNHFIFTHACVQVTHLFTCFLSIVCSTLVNCVVLKWTGLKIIF